jgi:predicted NAD/FAD-binding protein
VDTGFMVYNERNYPNLCGFFKEVGIEGIDTHMGFSVSMNHGSFEWCADSFAGLFATFSNLINPSFYWMLKDIFVFNYYANQFLRCHCKDNENMTVEDFLMKYNLSNAFRDLYLIPMTAAIWSATSQDMLNFPILSLLTFLDK